MTFLRQLIIMLCVIAFARVAMAEDMLPQPAPDALKVSGRAADVGTKELGIWTGYSDSNPTLFGRTTHRSLSELSIQYMRVVKAGETWALKYTAEIIPAVTIREPRQNVINGDAEDLPGDRQSVYGFGVTPLGFQMNFRRGQVLQPYINGSAGILFFEDKVPVVNSSRFNFSLGLGGGVQIWFLENQSLRAGYKYNHISNGFTARENPGMDSNLLYIGYSFSWR